MVVPTQHEILTAEVKAGHARGWSFVPTWGKRPRLNKWQEQKRETLAQALQWIARPYASLHPSRIPMYSIGLRCGRASGVYAIDIEVEGAGLFDDFPATVTSVTGSGGFHKLYTSTEIIGNRQKSLIHPWTGEKIKTVDVRGDGGQILLPGSIHPDTQQPYRWMEGRGPDEVPMAPFPTEWLAKPARPKAPTRPVNVTSDRAERRAMAYLRCLPDAIQGQDGSSVMFQAACTCWRFGLNESQVRGALEWFSANKSTPPWSDKEIDHKVRSSFTRVTQDGEMGSMLAEERTHAR